MQEAWFKGHKDREARKKEVLSYRNAFEDLSEVLSSKRKEPSRDYGVDWVNKQIAINEYNQAIDDLLNLIKLKED